MGIYTRPDSPIWWLYLETTKVKERTDIRIGSTAAQRRESKALAEDRYHQRMNELAARIYRLPSAQPAIRFDKYADTYAADVIPQRRGHERELELLKNLRAFFGDDLLTSVDQDRVRRYMTDRKATVGPSTINREVDLLKAMLRDAVPKYLPVSPLVGMKRLHVPQPRRRLLTLAEERKLLRKARPHERALLVLALDGLIRLNDLLDLQRTDRHGHWLSVADSKRGESYDIALSARSALALDKLPNEGPYYFARYRRARTERDRRAYVGHILERLCNRANVPYGKKRGGITFHWATRRTGATRLIVKQKQPIPAVQRQGNWKTADVLLSIYAEADKQAQRALFPVRSRSKRKHA